MHSENREEDAAQSSRQRLGDIIARYLEASWTGTPFDWEAAVSDNPDLARELLSFFVAYSQMKALAALMPPPEELIAALSFGDQPGVEHSEAAALGNDNDADQETRDTQQDDGNDDVDDHRWYTNVVQPTVKAGLSGLALSALVIVADFAVLGLFVWVLIACGVFLLAWAAVGSAYIALVTRDKMFAVSSVVCLVVWVPLTCSALSWFSSVEKRAVGAASPKAPPPDRLNQGKGFLMPNKAKLAYVAVRVSWMEDDGWVPAPPYEASATAFVFRATGDRLWLYTNAHVLGLDDAAREDKLIPFQRPELTQYDIEVTFPTGKQKQVARCADERRFDLACLEVDARGLTEGVDYVVVPYAKDVAAQAGDRVVSVGNSLGYLIGTQTFGRVSAIRKRGRHGISSSEIQHDAVIHPGNSGGPLFVEKDGRLFWIGINTWVEGDGLSFAIPAREAEGGQYVWERCNAAGAARLLQNVYGIPLK